MVFGANPGVSEHGHVCGLYYIHQPSGPRAPFTNPRKYLPTLSQSVHSRIVASTSRTTLTQTFVNPSVDESIPELRYTFPLYDGVSVVAFTCTVNNDRVIRGVVREKNAARKTYDDAVAEGQTAGLLEQLPDASDVFTTTIGNVPAAAEIAVDIEYLGELKHDAQVDGIRFTIPTTIAPRYGSYPGVLLNKPTNVLAKDGITIVVDAEVPDGSVIKSVQSPSHPIAVSVGSTSTTKADATPSLQLASATLSLGTAELDRDFIVHVIANNTSNPVAILETHPTLPGQQALMATLVPKFKMALTKPEIVFICDRSGSMEGSRIVDLRNALKIFLKSLPVGSMFNICSFGSQHSFLFEHSVTYDQDTLEAAMKHVDTFDANMGGTQMHGPIEQTFMRRHIDLDLEVFLLTDGEVWDEDHLFGLVNRHIQQSQGAIRLFTLGVGRDVSHSLIEGLARAGNGFSQSVSENEKMAGKVVRMLKGALTPHVNDYTLEIKYADAELETEPEDDFEMVEPGSATAMSTPNQGVPDEPKKPISLFDPSTDEDVDMGGADPQGDGTGSERYSHVPAVKPPKVLQAPFLIPPLFPYSRTSVYLLLSPDRELKNKTPESLVLRGTSSQGPLELRVPITVLRTKAETIHQLAARKAVKELEEGRGWIFHAKTKQGQFLKAKHLGRFPGMVEREAVRLGIRFQVGGKWCSFVAVDNGRAHPESMQGEHEEAPDKGRPANSSVMKKARGKAGRVIVHHRRGTGQRSSSSSPSPPPPPFGGFGGMPPAPAPNFAAMSFCAGPLQAAPTPPTGAMSCFSAPRPPAPSATQRSLFGLPKPSTPLSNSVGGSALFGGQPSGGTMGGYSFPAPMAKITHPSALKPFPARKARASAPSVQGGLFSRSDVPHTVRTKASAFEADAHSQVMHVDEASPEAFRKEMIDTALMFPSDDCCMSEEIGSGFVADYSNSAPNVGKDASPTLLRISETYPVFASPAEKFSAIVSLQDFSGFWKSSGEIFAILGVSAQEVSSAFDEAVTGEFSPNTSSTAAVVAFLRRKLADERDSWEMMEEKAVAWLEGELGEQTQDVLAAIERIF